MEMMARKFFISWLFQPGNPLDYAEDRYRKVYQPVR